MFNPSIKGECPFCGESLPTPQYNASRHDFDTDAIMNHLNVCGLAYLLDMV